MAEEGKCFVCGGELEDLGFGLPKWLDPKEILMKTNPLAARFYTGRGLREGLKLAGKHLQTKRCKGCGLLLFFEKKKT